MSFMQSMALFATGAAIGAYNIYRIKCFWETSDEDREEVHYGEPETFFQKLMRYRRYVRITQSAFDAAMLYGPSIFGYLARRNFN